MSFILLDSDILVALFYEDDYHYERVGSSYSELEQLSLIPAVSNYIIAEVVTVLSHKSGQVLANSFLDALDSLEVVHLSSAQFESSLAIFKQQRKKGTSFVDCSNVVLMQSGKFEYLWSFDKFYSTKNLPLFSR